MILCWGLTSQSTIFQSCRDGAIASWVINQYFRGVKCLAQGHNTAAVGFEPRTSRSGVRHSTTEPPRSPSLSWIPKQYIVQICILSENLNNHLNKKYHFDYVIFKTFPQYLTLYYYIILLCMLLLQKPRNTAFYHTKKSSSFIVISLLILPFLLI